MTVAKPGRTISVVIPTYNRCARLPAALDSICSQDVDGLEVIVVDNNSKDRTPEVVKAYPDPRVRYTLCTKQGIYHAINHGFAMATGDYLTWTSDDNLYFPGAIKAMLDAIESTGADFIYSDYESRDEVTGKGYPTKVEPPAELERTCCVGPCFLFRRRVYEQVGDHDARYRWVGDYDYWLRVYRAGFDMRTMSGERYVFLFHPGSETIKYLRAVQAETCKLWLRQGCYQKRWARSESRAACAESLRDVPLLWSHGYRREGLALLCRVFGYHPFSPAFWWACAGKIGRSVKRTFGRLMGHGARKTG